MVFVHQNNKINLEKYVYFLIGKDVLKSPQTDTK